MALPYIPTPHLSSGIQPYGMSIMAAVTAAAIAGVMLGRRRELSATDLGVLLPIAAVSAFLGAHLFDVIAYQLDEAVDVPAVWFRVYAGLSLFGAIAGVAVASAIIGWWRRLELPVVADVIAFAMLIAMTIGRVGCALVHDHLGSPTTSAFGVEFPASAVRWHLHLPPGATSVRLHDVGLEELLALVPILVACLALARLRVRAGVVAVVAALAYACVRFPLDFLRATDTEPRVAVGLTAGQLGCIVLAIGAAWGASRLGRRSHGP